MSHSSNPHTCGSALAELKAGNERFMSGKAIHPRQDKVVRDTLAIDGQQPLAAILACSDSRAPLELIFDQGLGDLFVVRVAGGVSAPTPVGSLEYAVEHLGVPVVLVLGHTQCGAVTAAVGGYQPGGALGELLAYLNPVVKTVENLPEEQRVGAAIEAAVTHAIAEFRAKSPASAKAESEGRLRIVGAVYHLETGKVVFC